MPTFVCALSHHAACTVVSTNYLVTLTVLRSIMLIMYRDHRVGREVLGGVNVTGHLNVWIISCYVYHCIVIINNSSVRNTSYYCQIVLIYFI